MNIYRIVYEFDNYEEAESVTQALEKSDKFFEDALGISGITCKAKRFIRRVEQLDNRGRPIKHIKRREKGMPIIFI